MPITTTLTRCSRLASLAVATLLFAGCSINRLASDAVADALLEGGTAYSSDEDIVLVGEAVPFVLKTVESLLEGNPEHDGLLQAAASGFTQYAYVYVHQPADAIELVDVGRGYAMRDRARRLYLRARNYGLRGLDARHPGFIERLYREPEEALADCTDRDVALLYWTTVASAAAVGLGKDDPNLLGQLPIIEAMAQRALTLDESYSAGDLHVFMINYEMARPGGGEVAARRAREHFERAVTLSDGHKAAAYVALAESLSVAQQDHAEFNRLLHTTLMLDIDSRPEWRLANRVSQERARWLLDHAHHYFSQ